MVRTRDIDDPGPGPRALDDRQQQPGQQEVGDVVDPKLKLEPVPGEGGCRARVLDPGAVDEDVHPALGLKHPRRELSDRVEAGQVTLLHLELALTTHRGHISAHTSSPQTWESLLMAPAISWPAATSLKF